MLTAKVFERTEAGPIRMATYCVDGLHVHLLNDCGIAIPDQRTVKKCDGSCEGKPAIVELEFPEEEVAKLRNLL